MTTSAALHLFTQSPTSTPTVPPLFNSLSQASPPQSVPVLPQIMAPLEEGIPLGRISVSEIEGGMGLTVRTGAFGPFPPFALPEHEHRPLEVPLRGDFLTQKGPQNPETGAQNPTHWGINFPESLGPPAALRLTAPQGPSELHEPSRGVLVPSASEGKFSQAPTVRSCAADGSAGGLGPSDPQTFGEAPENSALVAVLRPPGSGRPADMVRRGQNTQIGGRVLEATQAYTLPPRCKSQSTWALFTWEGSPSK